MAFFKQATKAQAFLRMALIGPSGSGKTYSALAIATTLAKAAGGKIALADTERGSASKYAGIFTFDAGDMEKFSPADFIRVIQEAEAAGYLVLVIDSLSHAWMGKGGALEMADMAAKSQRGGNSFTAWKSVTPEQNKMIDAILRARMHVIVTMRSKVEYVIEEKDGKKVPRKVGMAPVQRQDLEYEFDVVGEMNQENELVITKTRCPDLAGQVIKHPGEQIATTLRTWLSDGEAQKPVEAPKAAPALAVVPNQPAPADIPTGEPSEAQKAAVWFAECDNYDAASARAKELNAKKADFGSDWQIVLNAATAAIKRLKTSTPTAPGAA